MTAGGAIVAVLLGRWALRQLGAPADDRLLWTDIGIAAVGLALVAPWIFLAAGAAISAVALAADAIERRGR